MGPEAICTSDKARLRQGNFSKSHTAGVSYLRTISSLVGGQKGGREAGHYTRCAIVVFHLKECGGAMCKACCFQKKETIIWLLFSPSSITGCVPQTWRCSNSSFHRNCHLQGCSVNLTISPTSATTRVFTQGTCLKWFLCRCDGGLKGIPQASINLLTKPRQSQWVFSLRSQTKGYTLARFYFSEQDCGSHELRHSAWILPAHSRAMLDTFSAHTRQGMRYLWRFKDIRKLKVF